MEQKDKNWIEEAFKKATTIEGKPIDEFSEQITEAFKKEFPRTMTSFTMAYGNERAANMAVLMLCEKDIITLCRCFFVSGYVYRREVVEGTRKGDEEHNDKEGKA